ncbi:MULTISPECIES: cytochrome-c peroxidase [unclassified Robiginitalea]|uniref:cytochrome-c peroxidase n=1 Tax=Robiginitalea TaxID=252306 RepID=UPI002349F01F|nr:MULTISPECIES: cytochrome c peroxidase [unclassified Robiginitalea]MDC6354154.1 cytochrome c peroxidase [Robiginitalea sp. PM2]MDC6374421.1 cytochrome c peroxidase [Robiginitalea sp. SP8]
MYRLLLYLTLPACAFLLWGCGEGPSSLHGTAAGVADLSVPAPTTDNFSDEYPWGGAQAYYARQMETAIRLLDSMAVLHASKTTDSAVLRSVFREARRAFKRAEAYGSYLNPEIGHRANGPALPVFTDDSQRVLQPLGLQKVEETLFEGETYPGALYQEIRITRGLLRNLLGYIRKHPPTPKRYFISQHQQLMRVASLSITGFDTPVSLWGLDEAAVSLESMLQVYEIVLQRQIRQTEPGLDDRFVSALQDAVAYLRSGRDFMAFNRYEFLRDRFNPMMRAWVAIRKASGLWDEEEAGPFNMDAPTFFEPDSFNASFFMPVTNSRITDAQVLLGEKLFYDPNLSKSGTMSCASCHLPEQAWADGRVASPDNVGLPLERNTPTLVNSIFQQAFFWDGRSDDIMAQIRSVFTNEKEFDSGVHTFSDAILQDTSYIRLFEEAYSGVPTRNREVIKALSAYISTLTGMDSRFDRNIRGEETTLTESEIRGFNLFSGKALCATCHFLPLTNGTVPPFFLETEKEVIGVPETAANAAWDADPGFYTQFEEPIHLGMFKTPTVRNAAQTAPYMHNGVYATLEQVIEFYNLGGGTGLGFDLEHQTLPFDELQLTAREISDLTAFIRTLDDLPPSPDAKQKQSPNL